MAGRTDAFLMLPYGKHLQHAIALPWEAERKQVDLAFFVRLLDDDELQNLWCHLSLLTRSSNLQKKLFLTRPFSTLCYLDR